jgi:hypothetical protein
MNTPVIRPTLRGLKCLRAHYPINYSGSFNPTRYTATIFRGAKNNYVFNASTMWWPQWLNSDPTTSYPPDGGRSLHGQGKAVSILCQATCVRCNR